jgi:hypothetical protein
VYPLGKILHVADDVVLLPGSTKPSVVNLWEIVRVPAGATFPYALGKLCAVAWMRDGFGTARFRVDVVDPMSNTVIRRSQTYTYSFPDRRRSALIVIRLRDVVFPQPGLYLVEFFCEDQFIDDQPIQILP